MQGRGFVVNELTYPSNARMAWPGDGQPWNDADPGGLALTHVYAARAYTAVPAAEVMAPLLRRIGVEWHTLLNASDFASMAHTTDDEYDKYAETVWPRWTPRGPMSREQLQAAYGT